MGAAVSCISVHGGGHSAQILPATQLQPSREMVLSRAWPAVPQLCPAGLHPLRVTTFQLGAQEHQQLFLVGASIICK